MIDPTSESFPTNKSQEVLFQEIKQSLSNNPLCEEMKEEALQYIAQEAVVLKKYDDSQWLENKIEKYHKLGSSNFIDSYKEKENNLNSEKIIQEIKPSKPVKINSQQHLDEIIDKHQQWINSVLNPSENNFDGRANLKGSDLRNLNLKNANLSCANLSQANLSGLDLTNTNLSACQLQGANLKNADLRKTKLKNSIFDGADLESALLDPEFIKMTNLEKAQNVPLLEVPVEPAKELKAEQTSRKYLPTGEDKAHPLLDKFVF